MALHVKVTGGRGWLGTAALLFLFYVTVAYSHNVYLYRLYNYMGAAQQEITGLHLASWALFALLGAFFCNPRMYKPGDLVLAIMYVAVVPSVIVLQGASSYAGQVMLYGHVDTLVASVGFGVVLLSCFNALTSRGPANGTYGFNARFMHLLVAANLLALVLMVIYSASYFSFDFSGQYVRRLLARTSFPSGSPIAYYCSIMTQGLFPIFVGYGIQYRKRAYTVIGILNVMVLWGASGQKYPFIVFLLIVFILLWYRRFGFVRFNWLILGGITALLAGVAEDMIFGYSYINDYFLRRVFTVPSTLLGAAELFTSDYGFNHYSDTMFGALLTGVRTEPLSFLVGDTIFHSPGTNANVDFLAVAWMQGGFFAVLIEACIVGALVFVLNYMHETRNNALAVSIAILLATKIVEQSLPVALVSSGILMMILAAHFMMRRKPVPRAQSVGEQAVGTD
ncbi:hypothetical protein QCN28_23640 [Bordetella bronchiseptica]|uniref:hypothetical protein n=1 Tax=Bordetella bronchiseptica TaxID=518 RepID=UPI003F744EA8